MLLVALGLCGQALADADPASDILLGENVFYPYNPPVTARLQAELNRETAAAHRSHFPLKVALIATPVDLGAIPSFFGKPRQYAEFLDREISFGRKVPLLVVMPNGYGDAGLSSRARKIVGSLPLPTGRSSNALANAAIIGARKLSGAGHALGTTPPGSASSATSGSVVLPLVIVGAVCVLLAAAIIGLRLRRPRTVTRRR